MPTKKSIDDLADEVIAYLQSKGLLSAPDWLSARPCFDISASKRQT